jgi:hypothetical protein
MGTKITLYNVSIEGHEDVMAFLGEQDANTFSRIIFAGKDQYRISRSQVEADQIMEGYSWAVSNDSGDIPFDIVFFNPSSCHCRCTYSYARWTERRTCVVRNK